MMLALLLIVNCYADDDYSVLLGIKKGHEIEKGLTNLGNDHLKACIE